MKLRLNIQLHDSKIELFKGKFEYHHNRTLNLKNKHHFDELKKFIRSYLYVLITNELGEIENDYEQAKRYLTD